MVSVGSATQPQATAVASWADDFMHDFVSVPLLRALLLVYERVWVRRDDDEEGVISSGKFRFMSAAAAAAAADVPIHTDSIV